ncbi:sulfatase [Streptomyces uncialis]|uniref:sulfatase n=1 Tax=Streptomyces uncialis TaxID=1048205 RepID=UPI000B1477C3|nr:sulfatase [Streptomyces uncialis]
MPLFTRPRPRPDRDPVPVPGPSAEAVPGDLVRGAEDGQGGGVPRRPPGRRVAGAVGTASAVAFVLFGLLLPDRLAELTPGAFVRLPGEAVLGAALLLALTGRARDVVAGALGLLLGVTVLLGALDLGFHEALGRPFDPVLDWILLDDGQAFLRDSVGRTGALLATAAALALALAVLAAGTVSVVRLGRSLRRGGAVAAPVTLAGGTVWVVCAALGAQFAGAPLAARSTADALGDRVRQTRATFADEEVFERAAADDPFRDTPGDRLLTGLRGKDVLFVFVESYGRTALEDPAMAPHLGALLADGTERLRAAGYASRSGFLTSPTAGAGSWLAHSTFLSGLWVAHQQRYRSVTASDRLTLTEAFRRTGAWRTVGIMPGVTREWPEGRFYGLDRVYDSRELGYRGPKFSWAPVPDQFSLAAFERLEGGRAGRGPLMAGIVLVSSHNPWAPIPEMLGWDGLGDGSVYEGVRARGADPKRVWRDPERVRDEYRRSVEYSLTSLVSYLEEYGDEDTVLVFLGDHQPIPAVAGEGASRDVPVAMVAKDPAVFDRIGDWGWDEGLAPSPSAPVWRMDTFRDRFLGAFGPAS